jgi:Glycosyl hydrolase family 30 beta sandwich domain
MTGWEATAQSGESSSAAFDSYSAKLFSEAVNDLGINRLRLEIISGAENPVDYFAKWQAGQIDYGQYKTKRYEVINDNNDPLTIDPKGFQFSEMDKTIEKVVLPMRKMLAQRGESLYLNLNFVDFGSDRGSSNIRHNANPEEYAELMLAAYQHIQSKYGFVPDAVEVVLEPDNKTGWTAPEIGQAIVATAKRLQANNFKPAFIVPGTTNAANAPIFIDEIAKVPGAMQYVSEFSYHRYCCASNEVLTEIADRAVKYGKKTAMLEWIGADYQALHQDLKIARNSAWQQYTLAFPNEPDNGAQYFLIDDKNKDNPVVSVGKRTKLLRQYFRYIRAGAQRIGAETSNANLDPLAFINPNGKFVVIVKANVPGTVSLQGLPAGIYGISYATQIETQAENADIVIKSGENLSSSIPSAGVLTIFQK